MERDPEVPRAAPGSGAGAGVARRQGEQVASGLDQRGRGAHHVAFGVEVGDGAQVLAVGGADAGTTTGVGHAVRDGQALRRADGVGEVDLGLRAGRHVRSGGEAGAHQCGCDE